MSYLSRLFADMEARNPIAFPDFSGQPGLILASDYSGFHQGAKFDVSAFVLIDVSSFYAWNPARRQARDNFLPDGRRISFKGLRDGKQREFLPRFLSMASHLRGIVAVFATDHSVGSLFTPDDDLSYSQWLFRQRWQASVGERVLRVSHFASFLLAGLSHAGQNVFWFTDQDEIAPNEQRLDDFTTVWANVLTHYLQDRHSLAHIRCGTTLSDDGSREIEDLASIADLAAGATAEYLTAATNHSVLPLTSEMSPMPPNISPKTYALHDWLSYEAAPLRRVVVTIARHTDGKSLAFRHLRTQWSES
jgi:hypothetical protein